MNQEYLSQIKNSNLRNLLLSKEKIPILEELLNEESKRFKKLNSLKEQGKLDFGPKVGTKQLKELFPQVKQEVDSFLGVENIKTPKYSYFNIFRLGVDNTIILYLYSASGMALLSNITHTITGGFDKEIIADILFESLILAQAGLIHSLSNESFYNPLFKSIRLKKEEKATLIQHAAHEYTHYVQARRNISGIFPKKLKIFQEGHAIGVQKYISKLYREREDNPAFLFDTSDRNLGEFKSSYIWLCNELGKPINQTLLKTKSSRDEDERIIRGIVAKPTSHSIGNSLFSIYEAQQGIEIYNRMIHGDFQFN